MLPIEAHMISQLRMEKLHREAEAARRLAPFRRRTRTRAPTRTRVSLPARSVALIRRVLRTA